MVNNELDTNGFVTTDAINYVTDKHGSVVDVNSVKRSADRISEKTPGRYVVTYRYGKASGKVTVTVRNDANEGISKADAKLGKGGNVGKTWFAHELVFRGNYNAQVSSHTYVGTDKHGKKTAKLTTKFMSQILLACWKEARRPMSGEMFRVWMCMVRIWSRPTFMAGLNHPRTEPGGT